jgi:hypothetical protein
MAVSQATMKPPDMMGTVSQVMIGNNMPIILSLGLTYIGGMLVDDDSNGGDNQWRYQVIVTSAAGPIESIDSYWADYTQVNLGAGFGGEAVTGWFADWLYIQKRLGARPDTAFTGTGPHVLPNWTSDHKLSGYSAYRMQMKFDKDGVKFASGVPQWGVIQKGIKWYDPRKDTTYPGGSGSHRFNDEGTFEFGAAGVGTVAIGQNPGIVALGYARGRFIEKDAGGTPLAEPVKIAGIGLPWDAIKVSDFVELANLCDANGWVIGGAVYEGPGISKWSNLKSILQAASAEPVWSGGVLSLKWSSPKTPVFTITADDLADGDVDLKAMKGWRDRINTVVPRARLSTHKWEYEQLEAVSGATYVTEDGETKTREIQYDLVGSTDATATANQAAELAAYDVVNSREYGPITIPVKPYFMVYRPGEAGTVDLASLTGDSALGTQLCVITGKQVDPSTGTVLLMLESETTAKHAFALGTTGVAPPTPTIVPPEDLDTAVSSPGYDEVPSDPTVIELVEWSDRMVLKTTPVSRVQEYGWNIYDPGDLVTPIRTLVTTVPQVEYTKGQAHADGVRRDYVAGVWAGNTAGVSAELQTATLTKAAPAAPTGVAFADGTSTSTVTFTPSVSADASAHLIAYSTTSGFDPMDEGASFSALVSPAYTGQLASATYYGKVAAYDLWSAQPDLLNFSAEDTFVITPGGGGSPPPGGGGGGFGGGGGGGGGGGIEN